MPFGFVIQVGLTGDYMHSFALVFGINQRFFGFV